MKKYATVQTTFQISIHVDVNSVRIASFNSFSTHIEKLNQIIEDKVGILSSWHLNRRSPGSPKDLDRFPTIKLIFL